MPKRSRFWLSRQDGETKAHGDLLAEKDSLDPVTGRPLGSVPFVTEFRSGRRHYFCRAFLVDAAANDPLTPAWVLLERGPPDSSLSQVSQQFNLTQREGEAGQF